MTHNKELNILYEFHNKLYLNITNKCSCNCIFCLRKNHSGVNKNQSLWLTHEINIIELITALKKVDFSKYQEIIFCGYGEPTANLEVLLKGAKYLKNNTDLPVRVNTNGQGNLINEQDITFKFQGLIDTVSISLNNPNPLKYQKIVRSIYGEKSFSEMLKFVKNIKKYVPQVILTTVATTLTKAEEIEAKELCQKLGVIYKIREYIK